MSQPEQPPAVVPAFLEADRDTLRDQLSAAWQLQLEQVTQLLEQGWRDHLVYAVDERFAAIAAGMETETARRVAEATEAAETAARESAAAEIRRSTERLNQTARRLEQSEDAEAWGAALLDGLHAFAPHVALFSVLTGRLRYEGHRASADRNLDRLASVDVPVNEAPAFVNVLESLDTVIALATAGELSEPLAQALQTDPARRVCLLPVLIGRAGGKRRVAAVVYAESDAAPVDTNALEVLVSLAGAMLDCRLNRRAPALRPETPAAATAELVTIGAAPAGDETVESEPALALAPAPALAPPPLSELPREEQEWHARAQRFARVRVAEMRLYQAQAVRQGREHARLYMALRGEMDRSRAQFKHEFLHVLSMIDYFHIEVVRTLANDDPALLGQEYPGPLV
jgi:hypothetical protein